MLITRIIFNTNVTCVRNMSYTKVRTWYANLVKPKPTKPPYQHVVQIGDPILRTPANPIPIEAIKSPETQKILQKMYNILRKYNCVGLSAAQIGISQRIIMMEFGDKQLKMFSNEERKNREMSLMPLTVLINPEMKVIDYNKVVHAESCESIKGFYADVPRYKIIEVNGYNEDAEPIKIEANGWIARIIQHEMDHLNGKLYTDVMDRKTLCSSCWETVNERSGKVLLPYSPNV